MRIVLQRVSRASVTPSGTVQSSIARGIVLLVGFNKHDESIDLEKVVRKVCNCRIFPDEKGRFQHDISKIEGEIMVVPQFTLYADMSRGRRPDFTAALHPEAASQLFDQFVASISGSGLTVVTGVFGANMAVDLVNDGPVTLIFDINDGQAVMTSGSNSADA